MQYLVTLLNYIVWILLISVYLQIGLIIGITFIGFSISIFH